MGPGRCARPQAVQPEGLPVRALDVPRHEVPTTAGVHDAVRLQDPPGVGVVAAAVVRAQLLVITHGGCDGQQHVDVRARPWSRQRDDGGLQHLHAVPQPGWEHLFKFGQSLHRGLLDADQAGERRAAQPDSNGHRLLIGE
jgi:hypothetical protein